MARSKVVCIVLAAGLLLGACGGKAHSGEAFASNFCRAFGAWFTDISSQNQKVNSTVTPSATPAVAKRRLRAFFNAVVTDTDQFLRAIDAAGVPDVDGGQQFVTQMKEAFGKFKATYERARKDVERLPADPGSFRAGVAKVTSRLQSSLSGVNQAFSRQPSKEIKDAFEKSTTCQRLRQGSTGGASPGS